MKARRLFKNLARTAYILSVMFLVASVVVNFVPVQSVAADKGGHVCGDNATYNNKTKQCECDAGFEGDPDIGCTEIPVVCTDPNATWDGVACVCNTGYHDDAGVCVADSGGGGGGSGAIWTTSNACGDLQQDVNHFEIGDHVFINGSNFDPDTTYDWSIKGTPGSNDPDQVVASGQKKPNPDGTFCFDAYTVANDDGGEYQVKFGDKGDNYQVNAAEISLTKSADPVTYDAVGDVITYTYVIENLGKGNLKGPFTITDDKTTVTCPPDDLKGGDTLTCTATYTITQTDLDNGSVTNLAKAYGDKGISSNTATTTVNALYRLGISLEKSADPTTYAAVGDVISYTYVITNTGNVSLTGPFSVTDDKATVSCPAGGLAPGETLTCTASYTITQGDLDAGSVTNTATASGNDLTSNEAQATVNTVPESGIVLTKVADPTTYDTVGQVISYTYTVLNAGNVTLAGPITVTDDKATVTCPAGGLAPGASMDCTATYTITQADLDAGLVTNTAVAHTEQLDSNQAQATVTALQNPELTIVKTALPLTYTAAGDVISYSYLVTNTGNITVNNLNVVDDKTTVTCPVSSLSPSASTTCTATYIIKAGDLAAGSVVNTAYAEGLYGREQTVKSDDAAATVTRFIPLGLAAICASDPTVNNGWTATNSNPYPVDYEASNSDGSYTMVGALPIPATSSVNFETPISAGNFVKLFSGGVLQDSATAATDCIPVVPPPPPPEPLVPVTGNVNPPVAIGGVTPPLIPVTGLDTNMFEKTLPRNLFSVSMGFLGLGLVLSGIARRREDE